jgi:putative Mg2+ transporter-C (MgtC) family protein
MVIPEEIVKLFLAVLVGGLIGAEREYRDKSAGFRTIIFITLGSTLFTLLSMGIGSETNPTRIAANIVTGIGFLGAGAIMREDGRVAGLTTAATIWLTAALGTGIGAGKYELVAAGTIITLVVLWFFPAFEHWLDRRRETRSYEIIVALGANDSETLRRVFTTNKLRILNQKQTKADGRAIFTILTDGNPAQHAQVVRHLMDDKAVLEFRYH